MKQIALHSNKSSTNTVSGILLGWLTGIAAAAILLTWSTVTQAELVQDLIQSQITSQSEKPALHVAGILLPQAVAEFYVQEKWQPVWDAPRFQALLHALSELEMDGLNPEDYAITQLKQWTHESSPQKRAERDLLATRAYLLALLHLYHGKVNPQQIDPNWNFDSRQLDPKHGLSLARQALKQNDIAGLFNRARPDALFYSGLREALKALRTTARNGDWTPFPSGSTLRLGMTDSRVPLLRNRMLEAGYFRNDSVEQETLFDSDLADAVRRFQASAFIDADGVVGPRTVEALNISVHQRIDQIRVNLERARWLLHALKGNFVIVDIAGFHVAYVQAGTVQWHSRVQVGKAYRRTPVFKSVIDRITISPSWVIPPTIFRQDTLPAIRRDPNYLSRHRLRVFNSAGRELSPANINWSQPGNITLRQEPGPSGALGELAIRFPNPYAVYLHDTPHQSLFNKDERATSSGCIRVERIHELAEILLNDSENWNRAAMQKAIEERKTREVILKNPIPILLAYWTVDVSSTGVVSFKNDIYKRDRPVLDALNKAP